MSRSAFRYLDVVTKVGYEALATPLTYAIVGFLKRSEGVDVYDYGTNFSPFALREGEGWKSG